MAITRAYLRSFAAIEIDLNEIMAQVNQMHRKDMEKGRYVTLALIRLDHRNTDTILNRVTGIQVLHLCKDFCFYASGQTIQFDQRRVPYQPENILVEFHHYLRFVY